jgi:hypothetical protein
MKIGRFLSYFSGLAISLAAGWTVLPQALYKEVPQPAPFSHAAHTGEKGGMQCTDCHAFRTDGTFAGIPKLETCAGCHAEPVGETASEKRFVEEFVKKEREPQWQIYSRQPDNAWFPHSVHVTRGKLACKSCHGSHGKSAALPPYRVNRISGYSQTVMAGMRMDNCVACHRQRGLSHSCLDCHK